MITELSETAEHVVNQSALVPMTNAMLYVIAAFTAGALLSLATYRVIEWIEKVGSQAKAEPDFSFLDRRFSLFR